jgi:hypothetical protein
MTLVQLIKGEFLVAGLITRTTGIDSPSAPSGVAWRTRSRSVAGTFSGQGPKPGNLEMPQEKSGRLLPEQALACYTKMAYAGQEVIHWLNADATAGGCEAGPFFVRTNAARSVAESPS